MTRVVGVECDVCGARVLAKPVASSFRLALGPVLDEARADGWRSMLSGPCEIRDICGACWAEAQR